MSGGSASAPALGQRAARGALWLLLLRFAQRGVGVVRLLVLTLLLGPEQFGLAGIALLLVESLATLSQTGFRVALIQRLGSVNAYLDCAWTALLLRGAALCLLLLCGAEPLAQLFHAPEAAPLVRAVGVAVLLQSCVNIGVVVLERELDFRRLAFHQLAGTACDLVASIAAGIALRNAWALVIGLIAGDAARLLTSYWVHPHRPRLRFDAARTRELFHFGKWLFLTNLFLFLAHRGDDLVVGTLLGASALGLYQLAYQIAHLPILEVSRVAAQVALPSYARLQTERAALRRVYFKVVQGTALLAWPIAALVCLCARDFTHLVLGEAWWPIVPLVEILAVHSAIRSLGATAGPVLIALGRPQVGTALTLLKCAVIGLAIFPLVKLLGLPGVALAVLAGAVVSNLATNVAVIQAVGCRAREVLSLLAAPAAASLGMAGFLATLQRIVPVDGLPMLVLHAGLGIAVYALGALLLGRLGPHPVGDWVRAVRAGLWLAGKPAQDDG